jgi:hypothetical protein
MKILKYSFFILTVFVFFSCKKTYIEPSAIKVDNKISQAGVPTYPLDWEALDFMPTPPGTPTVIVPWGSGASSQFTKEMANDYHKADGWSLVYNTFNTTTAPDNWYFMLYNVYRGILRMYYYVPSTANYIPSANIIHMLSTEGSHAPNSVMLNFAKDIVDVDIKHTTASTVEQWQVARSTWYIFEYELAYDQYMSSQNFNSFSFKWPVRSGQITNVNINGQVSASLTGTLSLPGSNLTISPSFAIDGSRGNTTITVNGSSAADKLQPTLGQRLVDGIKTGIVNGAKGVVGNILSGLFKKNNSSTDQNVNLKLQGTISLNGTLTSDFLVTSPTFAIPGYNQSSTPGILPDYNQPLGVFYITGKPTIINTRSVRQETLEDGTRQRIYTYDIQIDPNSYQFYFNPVVTNIATIQNLRVDVVSLGPRGSNNYTVFGSPEVIPGYSSAYGRVWGGESYTTPMTFGQLALRVSFEVVPNNGATPAFITKTFAANVNEIL